MVDVIVCFLTCGYTEAGAMQFFLKKINDRYEYRQCLPNKTIKKKGMPKKIDDKMSGRTGEALLEKVYELIEKHRDEYSQCRAILVEDDLDGRFAGYSQKEVGEYNRKIIEKIQDKLGKKLPVFVLYASPEAESWFIADWENGYKYLYCDRGIVDDVENDARQFFVYHLKEYIDNEILKEYKDNIEEYGYFDGKYIKISDEIIDAVQSGVKEKIGQLPRANKNYVDQIRNSRKLYYSKKLHGQRMLKNIHPDIVADKCKRFFGDTYKDLSLNFISNLRLSA